jgi:uroporphyrin-III C-methyltransferase/precorrin-2 dehydrogenase/sirohydrochlorin ferrochelatase/uroporphyrin-III C-methyltransferase
MNTAGFVSLVGAGPGDPDLLTVKALRRLQEADVVVFDRLVSSEILDLIPHGVGRISVGKSPGRHCVTQRQINDMIVGLAQSGRRVVRLKGGDPYIFGRGGEEALALRDHGIRFEVVPGITAAAGCSSYAGIPLTHRGLSRGVHLVTGQLQDGADEDIDWQYLAGTDSTLVIYMGLATLPQICERLRQAGMPAEVPAAAIHDGTGGRQQKIVSTLAGLADAVADAALASPVTTIIGEVVSLTERLDWFEAGGRCTEVDSDETFDRIRA